MKPLLNQECICRSFLILATLKTSTNAIFLSDSCFWNSNKGIFVYKFYLMSITLSFSNQSSKKWAPDLFALTSNSCQCLMEINSLRSLKLELARKVYHIIFLGWQRPMMTVMISEKIASYCTVYISRIRCLKHFLSTFSTNETNCGLLARI